MFNEMQIDFIMFVLNILVLVFIGFRHNGT